MGKNEFYKLGSYCFKFSLFCIVVSKRSKKIASGDVGSLDPSFNPCFSARIWFKSYRSLFRVRFKNVSLWGPSSIILGLYARLFDSRFLFPDKDLQEIRGDRSTPAKVLLFGNAVNCKSRSDDESVSHDGWDFQIQLAGAFLHHILCWFCELLGCQTSIDGY